MSPVDNSGRADDPVTPVVERAPNYAARRMLTSTIVITVIILGIVAAYRALSQPEPAAVDWNRALIYDTASGAATLIGNDGLPLHRYRSPVSDVVAVYVDGTDVVIEGTSQIAHFDITSQLDASVAHTSTASTDNGSGTAIETTTAQTVASIPAGFETHILPASPLRFVFSQPGGGNLIVTDPTSGATLDFATGIETQPQIFYESLIANDAADRFALADTTTFTSLVGGFDTPISQLAGTPLAVGDNLAATAQLIGDAMEVTRHNLATNKTTTNETVTARTGIIAVARFDGDRLQMIDVDGNVIVMQPDGTVSTVDKLMMPSEAEPQDWYRLDGDRSVVIGDVFVSILDGDAVVATQTFSEIVQQSVPPGDALCWPVAVGNPQAAVVNLQDSQQDGQLVGRLGAVEVVSQSGDGCSLLTGNGENLELINIDPHAVIEAAETIDADVGWVSPKGQSVIVGKGSRLWWRDADREFDLTAAMPADATIDDLGVVFFE